MFLRTKVSVTFSQPHFQGWLLAREKFDWSVKHWTFGEHFHYFYYHATKGVTQDLNFDYSYIQCTNKALSVYWLQCERYHANVAK